jgi:hypothetical protein
MVSHTALLAVGGPTRGGPLRRHPLAGLDYVTLAIRNCHDAGNVTIIRNPLAILVTFLDRLGPGTSRRPPSPVSRTSPLTAVGSPAIGTTIAHLRDVLGDQTYESLSSKGAAMTTAAMAHLRIRPNQPGPNRAEHRLVRDHIRDTRWHDLRSTCFARWEVSQKFVSEIDVSKLALYEL